jgi:hypothetical protein
VTGILDPVELWFRDVKSRLPLENQNRLSVFVGPTGSGKSWATVSTAERMFPEFDPAKHIAYFDPWAFIEIVRNSKKGDVIIFDEAGVGMDNRDWQTKSNKIMTKITQTFRTKNLFVFFTAPSFGFVDIKLRQLFHDYIRMDRVNFKAGYSEGQWYNVGPNVQTGDLFFQPLTLTMDGRRVDCSHIQFKAPKPETTKVYEELRKVAADKLFTNADELRSGGDRAVTIEQAAKMLQLENTNILYMLIREGVVPVYRESSFLKVSMGWIRDVAHKLVLRDPYTIVRTKPLSDVEKLGLRHVYLGGDFTLVPQDAENEKKVMLFQDEVLNDNSDIKPEGFLRKNPTSSG